MVLAFSVCSCDFSLFFVCLQCEDRNASPGNCPWCLAKGQKNALRFYAVNLEDTVMLCTNPAVSSVFFPLFVRKCGHFNE